MSVIVQESRRTLALAGPIIVGQVSQMLLGVTDSLMIGHVGKVPLAASAFAHSVFNIFFVVGLGVLVPVAVLVSRSQGAGDEAGSGTWMRHGVALACAYSLLAGLGMLILGGQLHWFGQPDEVVAQVQPYYTLITVSLWPVLLFQVLRQLAEALGRPMIPMLLMLGAVLLNVMLNWILIYGNLGAPALGLAGAGWATLLARTASVVAILVWLRRAAAFHATWPPGVSVRWWWSGFSSARFREMLRLGVPAAGSLLFESGAFSAAALMMGWISVTALAAHQIALSCAGFTFMFPLGLSMAVSMRLARAVGQGRTASLRPIAWGAQGMSALLMVTFAVVFALAGRQLASGFVQDPAVIQLAAQLLVVAAIFQLFDGGQVVGVAALRGLEDVKVPTIITCIAYWGVALPLGYFLGVRLLGAIGIWVGLACGLALAAVCLGWRFHRLTDPARPGRPVFSGGSA